MEACSFYAGPLATPGVALGFLEKQSSKKKNRKTMISPKIIFRKNETFLYFFVQKHVFHEGLKLSSIHSCRLRLDLHRRKCHLPQPGKEMLEGGVVVVVFSV